MDARAVRPKQKRMMKLAVFQTGDGNYHMAGWRLPGSTFDGGQNIRRWVDAARIMERGKLDMLFIADTVGTPGSDFREQLSFTSRVDRFEPLTVLSAPFAKLSDRDATIAYAMSTVAAKRLLDEAGGAAVANLLRDLGNGVDFETAFLHRTLRSFEDFQASLGQR